MPVFYLDDRPIEFEAGEKVLAAAHRAGITIPHYCYHPGMSVVATCRMCVVDIVDLGNGRGLPKLQTACSTDAAPGMKVVTKNNKVADARERVMEFLLINHPLDCPICDQSGECELQDYSVEHGSGKSDMEYSKRIYGLRDIGTFVTLERNRCIHCSRCDRFTREVTGSNEFGMFQRGHELTLDTYDDRPMVNHFQGNMADLCPVGAITEKEFRFKRRVWKLSKVNSICLGCSTGCNITIEHNPNEVFRLKPRENQDVNQWWMCDEGRLTYHAMNEKKLRIKKPQISTNGKFESVTWTQAYEKLGEMVGFSDILPEEVVAITDTHSNNEELFLLKQLLEQGFGSDQIFFPLNSWEQPQSDFFINTLITSDKTPNRTGAIELQLKGDEDGSALKSALSQKVKFLFVLGNPFSDSQELQELAANAGHIIYIGTTTNGWSDRASLIFPGQYYSEKSGTYINKNRRIQATHPATRPIRHVRPEWRILTELLQVFQVSGKDLDFGSASEVFDAMAKTHGFPVSYEQIGEQGISL